MIGFDIGGTKCAVTLGRISEGELIIEKKHFLNTDKSVSPYDMIEKMCEIALELENPVEVVGISCGGPLDSEKGVILSPPNLPGWDNIEIVSYVEKRLGCRAYIQNDANACAVAEWLYGAGKGSRNMVFLTFGTGLGAGLILDGKLYSGTNDNAGEVGHIRLGEYGPAGYGKMGSFEGFCSGSGIGRLASMMALEKFQMGKAVSYCADISALDKITAKDVAIAANNGCPDAVEVYRKCGEKLGLGLSVIVDILNPEVIVIGSVYARCENLLRDAMLETLKKEALPLSLDVCEVCPAALGENIGDYAALSVAAMNM